MKEYKYKKVNSIKAIVENGEGKVLLIQEPVSDDWMPLHWGLPGGRPKVKESLREAFKRTIKEEIGLEIEPMGLYRIEEVLHGDRTVLMFIVVAKTDEAGEIKGRINAYKWATVEDISKMETTEFTAFYAKKLLLDYLMGDTEYIDIKVVETQQYYDLDESPEFQKWLASGKRDVESQG